MTFTRAAAAFGLLLLVGLAGCADDGGDNGSTADIDINSVELGLGKGAIAGLLVDDRFRPIQLVDNPQTEFQATGFVLLQETGEKVQTTENGEFYFLDLEPGAYTVRVQADGHEAIPTTLDVDSGSFAESNIVARRINSEGSIILTQEFAIFVDCWYITPIFRHTEVNCFLDLSRDSKRGAMRGNFSTVGDVSYVVAEFVMNQPGDYDIDVGFGKGESVQEVWARGEVRDSDYGKLVLPTDPEVAEADEAFDGVFDNTREFIAVLWPVGGILGQDIDPPVRFGAGIATEAQVLVSLFLGEPEADVLSYCALCNG